MGLRYVLLFTCAFAIVAGCSALLAGCSGATVSSTLASASPTSSVTQAETGVTTTAESSTTATSEAATTTSTIEETTTSSTVAVLDTTTTVAAVQVTNESGSSPCYIRDILSQGGKHYIVVDYIQVVNEVAKYGEYHPVLHNTNPQLRTFLVPSGLKIATWMLLLNLGKATEAQLDAHWGTGLMATLDDLKQAEAKGNLNTLPKKEGGWSRWWELTVKNGRVVSLSECYWE